MVSSEFLQNDVSVTAVVFSLFQESVQFFQSESDFTGNKHWDQIWDQTRFLQEHLSKYKCWQISHPFWEAA